MKVKLATAAAVLLVLAAAVDGAAGSVCEKRKALDAYLKRLADGTTGFEREARAEQPSSAVNKSAVNYQGCAAPGAEQFAFCDTSLPTKERVEDLLTRFTLDQKLGMISPNPTLGDTCVGTTWNGTSLGNASFLKQVCAPARSLLLRTRESARPASPAWVLILRCLLLHPAAGDQLRVPH